MSLYLKKKLGQSLNFSSCGGSLMFKWPEKKYYITWKLFLVFRIIKTTMYVLGDYRKKGQIWNKFDDSGAKLGHQRNTLTISDHLDAILLIFDKYGRKIANLGQSIEGIEKIENDPLKHLIWLFQLKNSSYFPRFSAVCGLIFKNKVRICSVGILKIQKC